VQVLARPKLGRDSLVYAARARPRYSMFEYRLWTQAQEVRMPAEEGYAKACRAWTELK
jgi:hypothetical protein